MSAPSKGPWSYQVDPKPVVGRAEVVSADGTPVAALWRTDGDGSAVANARLIAAAPDLKSSLAALLRAADEEIEQRKHSGNEEDWRELQALSDAGHAAIARSEGRP